MNCEESDKKKTMALREMEQNLSFLRQRVDDAETMRRAEYGRLRQDIDVMQGKLQAMMGNVPDTALHGQGGLVSARTVPVGRPVPSGLVGRQPPVAVEQKEKKDVERFVGQSVMGILAVMLIFISMGVFAAMVFPSLPVPIRILMLYAASGLLSLFSAWMMKRRPGNLSMTIAGLSAGAVYVSIVLTGTLLFQDYLLADISMFILLFLWCICMLSLASKYGRMFEVISHVGITVGFLLGLMNIGADMRDSIMLPMLVLFFITAQIVAVGGFQKRKDRFHSAAVSTMLCAVLFSMADAWNVYWGVNLLYDDIGCIPAQTPVSLQVSRIMMVLAVLVVSGYVTKKRSRNTVIALIQDMFVCAGMVAAANIGSNVGDGMLFGILGMGLGCFLLWQHAYENGSFSVVTACITVLAYLNFTMQWDMAQMNLAVVFPVLLLAALYRRKDMLGTYCGLAVIYGLTCAAGHPRGDVVMPLAMVMGTGLFVWAVYRQGSREDVLCGIAYLLSLFTAGWIVWLAAGHFTYNLPYPNQWAVKNAALSAVMVLFLFCKSTPRTGLWVCIRIVHVIAMLECIRTVYLTSDYAVLHMLAIILAVAGFAHGVKYWLQYAWGGIYVGLKFTWLCYAILHTAGIPQYGISIGFFLLAAGTVAYGFKFKFKSLRVFGLILSCISVCKLILADLSYEQVAMKAASFLICGLLCLGINVVYNLVGKKQDE